MSLLFQDASDVEHSGSHSLTAATNPIQYSNSQMNENVGTATDEVLDISLASMQSTASDASRALFSSSNDEAQMGRSLPHSVLSTLIKTAEAIISAPPEPAVESASVDQQSSTGPADTNGSEDNSSRPTRGKRAKAQTSQEVKMCTNCETTFTSQWRTDGKNRLCNKCGLYWERKGKMRPGPFDKTVKRRKRRKNLNQNADERSVSSSSSAKRKRSQKVKPNDQPAQEGDAVAETDCHSNMNIASAPSSQMGNSFRSNGLTDTSLDRPTVYRMTTELLNTLPHPWALHQQFQQSLSMFSSLSEEDAENSEIEIVLTREELTLAMAALRHYSQQGQQE